MQVTWSEEGHVITGRSRDQRPVTWSEAGHVISGRSRDQRPVTWSEAGHMIRGRSHDQRQVTWLETGQVIRKIEFFTKIPIALVAYVVKFITVPCTREMLFLSMTFYSLTITQSTSKDTANRCQKMGFFEDVKKCYFGGQFSKYAYKYYISFASFTNTILSTWHKKTVQVLSI